jgi:hypothetical protein
MGGFLAPRANPFNFDCGGFSPEASFFRGNHKGGNDRFLLQFPSPTACLANQELGAMNTPFPMVTAVMAVRCMRTGNESTQTLQTMNQTLFQKKIYRPIDGGRRCIRMRRPQTGQ